MGIPRVLSVWWHRGRAVFVERLFRGPQGVLVVETAPCVPGPGGRVILLSRFWSEAEPYLTPLGEQVLHVPSVSR